MYTREQWANLIHTEPHRIGHLIGFKDLTPLHSEWMKSMLFEQDDQTLQGHRGSYKTTTLSLTEALLIVWQPNDNILFFRKTDTDVGEVITQTSKILRGPVFQVMVNDLYGCNLVLLTDTKSEITTNLTTSPRGVSQLIGLGIGTSITGKHADIVITDDIVNVKDRVSQAERERTKLAYQELQNIKNRGGRFINTGTPWHKEDAFSLMPNIKKYDCYHTGLISPEELSRLRESMSPSLFAANYELRHIADADALFSEPHYCQDETLIHGGQAHVDAAYGGGDYTAYTVMRQLDDGRIIGYGRLWSKHVDSCLEEMKALHQRMQAGSIACETNGDKGYLAKEMKSLGWRVDMYSEHMNKYLKISTYLRANWKSIEWIPETDPDYIDQILDYTENADHDDAPDSAASLVRRLGRKTFSFD